MSKGEGYQKTQHFLPSKEQKSAIYQQCEIELRAMLEGVNEPLAIFSTVIAVLHHQMPHYFWTGMYRDVDGMLHVGPYQGTPACLSIAYDRGVCGAVWSKKRSIVVKNVHDFPGHIACDSRSQSEIVVPWFFQGKMIGVLDVDSTLPAAFDEIDLAALERLSNLW